MDYVSQSHPVLLLYVEMASCRPLNNAMTTTQSHWMDVRLRVWYRNIILVRLILMEMVLHFAFTINHLIWRYSQFLNYLTTIKSVQSSRYRHSFAIWIVSNSTSIVSMLSNFPMPDYYFNKIIFSNPDCQPLPSSTYPLLISMSTMHPITWAT